MLIEKNKQFEHLYDVKGITEGKLTAIARALQAQKDNRCIGAVGEDVLQTILVTLNMAKIDKQINEAIG